MREGKKKKGVFSGIYEEIHQALRLKKTELLLGKSSGVCMASTTMKKDTLEKNKERIQLAKGECETLSEKIKKLIKTGLPRQSNK